ncbi:hypothetical protein [Rheinheimera aquimaris]|uniref:hypothetical protein n=1 Tax=Rheinheimera aquimaris TaxID=412437 RepID=UPI001E4C0D9D|nr:hypothetical protein [Rheinheimera aquimaris]MCD1598228.1 hypothetical protein [Rheinheimera aquimaris]
MKTPVSALPFAITLACSVTAISAPVYASLNEKLSSAIKQSAVSAQFRYRLEQVEQENALDDAIASTLRSRLTVNTGTFDNFSAMVQLDNVSVLGNDNYNSSYNGKTNYSLVADPKGTDINQALLSYQNSQGTSFSAGRQLVNHANQRFLGGVGWRQNEQTLDGYRLQHSFSQSVNVELGHYYNVNRIFGPKGAAADQHGSFNTLTAHWQASTGHKFLVFAYDFEFDNWAIRSSRTLGIDYQGKLAALPQLSWHLSLAQQDDAHNAIQAFSHNYHRISLNWTMPGVTVQAGQERLAGDGQTAFQTPLATLHAFSGFADMFLNTPDSGLRDNWLQLNTKVKEVGLMLGYHQFDSDVGSVKYGDEWNASISYNLNTQLSGMLKLARYNADSFAVETTKIWLMLVYQL